MTKITDSFESSLSENDARLMRAVKEFIAAQGKRCADNVDLLSFSFEMQATPEIDEARSEGAGIQYYRLGDDRQLTITIRYVARAAPESNPSMLLTPGPGPRP